MEAETRGATEGEWLGLLGLFHFGYSQNWDFSKKAEIGRNKGLFLLLRYLMMFYLYIDNFKHQNHHFSQKYLKNFRKIYQFQRNFAPAAPKVWDFSQFFPPKSSDFSQKGSPPILGRSLPPVAPLENEKSGEDISQVLLNLVATSLTNFWKLSIFAQCQKFDVPKIP